MSFYDIINPALPIEQWKNLYVNSITTGQTGTIGEIVYTDKGQELSNKILKDNTVYEPLTISTAPLVEPLALNELGKMTRVSNLDWHYKYTMSTVGALPDSENLTLPYSDKPLTAKTTITGIVTAGPLAGNVFTRIAYALFEQPGGVATFVSQFGALSSDQNVGTAGVTLQHVAATNKISPVVTGVASNSITYFGITEIVPL